MKCSHCEAEINNYNYCPNCGTPLTENTINLENTKILNTRLETLLKVTEIIDDEKALNTIKELVLKLKKEQ